LSFQGTIAVFGVGSLSKDIKRLLIVTSDLESTDQIKTQFKEEIDDLKLVCASSGEAALETLKKQTFDCMVMVDDLEDIHIGDLAKRIRVNDLSQTPIILYTDSEKTSDISEDLARYIESIILKGDKSMDRLIDETTLFLNHIEESNKVKAKEYMRSNKEKQAILKGKKVLIVDDDMRNTFALSSALEEDGLDIVIAKNGQVAIEKLEENPDIDIVLMDIMMPVMDGYAAMRKIRSMKAPFSSVPIIALTAKAMREDKEKCISAGASDYLAKPVKFDELVTLMKVWIY
jgi:tubulin-specific chaperone A